MIDLHYGPTMNAHKVLIMFEETGLEYRLYPYDLLAGEHLNSAFHALNPNHKIPVIVDNSPSDGGGPLTIFESAAILQYLAEKTGQLMPRDFRRREAARQWLTWQVAALGPTSGQAGHFLRYAPKGQDHAIERYTREAKRLAAVLDERLANVGYLAEEYSIADIACWAFMSTCEMIGIDPKHYPSMLRWRELIARRPAVQRVVNGEQTSTPEALLKSSMTLTEDQWSNVFGDRMLNAASLRGGPSPGATHLKGNR